MKQRLVLVREVVYNFVRIATFYPNPKLRIMNSHFSPVPFPAHFPAPILPKLPDKLRPQMYTIALETGSNEHYNLTLISVTDDFAAGQSWVEKMNALYKSLLKKRHQLVLATLAWRQKYPIPAFTPVDLLALPELAADKRATAEERDEKHRINNENLLRSLAARDPQRQWARQELAFEKAWFAENLTPDEALLESTANENCWSIQPVVWHPR